MSIFCSIDKSTTGTTVFKISKYCFTAKVSHKTVHTGSRSTRHHRLRYSSSLNHPVELLRTWFAGALVTAGACRKSVTVLTSGPTFPNQPHQRERQRIHYIASQTFSSARTHHTKVIADSTDDSEYNPLDFDDSNGHIGDGHQTELGWIPQVRSRVEFDFRSKYVTAAERPSDEDLKHGKEEPHISPQEGGGDKKKVQGDRFCRLQSYSLAQERKPWKEWTTALSKWHSQDNVNILHDDTSPILRPYPNLFKPRHAQYASLGDVGAMSKEELLSLAGQYSDFSATDQLPLLELPNLRYPTKPKVGPNFELVDKAVKAEWPQTEYVWPASGDEKQNITTLLDTLNDMRVDSQEIYRLYRALPAPRMPYLHWQSRNKLLKRLGILERKDEMSMVRYLSLVDDMKACDIPIMTWQWNIALSFTGRYVSRTTDLEVHRALQFWRGMERTAGVQSNEATFNILFDVATKAGKFQLAEMIYKEMERRGLPFNRFHYVSLINYKGLAGDGEGVRAAYKQLVLADEVVDTVVLNCMIRSFFLVGEPQSAQLVYARMKAMHEKKTKQVLPPRDFHTRRAMNHSLYKLAEQAKLELAGALNAAQEKSVVAPDAGTYALLIQHTAVTLGDLSGTIILLDEMRAYEVSLRGGIFLSLFKGFMLHSHTRYSQWNIERLNSVWRAFLIAVQNNTDGIYLGRWALISALEAFTKTAGKARALEAFEEAKSLWKPSSEEAKDHVLDVLRSISEQPDRI